MEDKIFDWVRAKIEYHQTRKQKASNHNNWIEASIHQSKIAAYEELLIQFSQNRSVDTDTK